ANDGKGTSILDNLSSLNITILPQTTVTTKETGIVGGTKANPKLILELLTKQNTDPIVAFSFKLQGAENPDYYEVTIDNGIKEIWPTIKSASYETRVLSPGNHSIGVTAVYKNNYSLNATQDFVIEPLVVPIVKNLPSQINEDDILEFEVLTNYPEANIVLEFQPLKGGEAVIVNLITNSDGNLSVSLKNILSEGSYLIKTKVFLVNSASSQYSTPAILQVNLSKLNQIQLLASAYLKIIVLLAGIAVTLTVAILYILGRIRRYRKDYNRKVDEVFANLDTEGRHIIELSDDVTGMSDREQGDAEKYRDILTKNRQTLYPPKK
ncbi:MAG: hypothetical protein NTX26_02345, partial [Candidatus Parcubacteria bacterium]|nr:hypothetical protein [Candidatus Parcubacteria bacterium]